VDTGLFRPDRATDEARATLNGNGKQVALYAGLHGLAQGLTQVLEAAEGLAVECDLDFVFVGDGPEKTALVEQAKQRRLDNVRFLQSHTAREIPALIASADIVLVPLKLYIPGAVPSKLYEAMASGRPVVLVAEGEAADIVREHEAGVVVKPGDIEGLIEAIRMLHLQPSLRRTLGENGRRAAKQLFDRTTIMTHFVEHLESAMRT
jgi:glycosyltransferase involved in cell wall biosynthesis